MKRFNFPRLLPHQATIKATVNSQGRRLSHPNSIGSREVVICSLFIAMIFDISCFAQVNTAEWILLSEKSGVQAFYKLDKCGSQELEPELLFLKFTNNNSNAVEVRWEQELVFGSVETWSTKDKIDSEHPERVAELSPGESKEGHCRISNMTVLLYRIDAYLKKEPLTKVSLIEFNIYQPN
jgi:hypothetical protein